MDYPSGQLSIVNSLPTVEPAQFSDKRLKQFETSLLIETALVTTAAILAIRFFGASSFSRASWLAAPSILIAAALVPTVIKRAEFAKIGFSIKQVKFTLLVVCWTCVVIFPATFCGLWLLKSCGLELPLRPALPQGQGWAGWLFYQFMYVAVAEEVLFGSHPADKTFGKS